MTSRLGTGKSLTFFYSVGSYGRDEGQEVRDGGTEVRGRAYGWKLKVLSARVEIVRSSEARTEGNSVSGIGVEMLTGEG